MVYNVDHSVGLGSITYLSIRCDIKDTQYQVRSLNLSIRQYLVAEDKSQEKTWAGHLLVNSDPTHVFTASYSKQE